MKIILILISFNFCLFGQTHYVSRTATSIPPYSSWETAADSISKALDVCSDGDTVFIANGEYRESLVIDKEIVFIGQSCDSTIINGRNLEEITVRVLKSCTFESIKFIGKELVSTNPNSIMYTSADSTIIYNCWFDSTNIAISSNGSFHCENILITDCRTGLGIADFDLSASATVTGCQFIITQNGTAIVISSFGNLTITNNVFLQRSKNGLNAVVRANFEMKSLRFANNIIQATDQYGIRIENCETRPEIINNIFSNQWGDQTIYLSAINAFKGTQPIIKNNIFFNCNTGVYLTGQNAYTQDITYNTFFNVDNPIIGAPP